jgi:hypothetical protein
MQLGEFRRHNGQNRFTVDWNGEYVPDCKDHGMNRCGNTRCSEVRTGPWPLVDFGSIHVYMVEPPRKRTYVDLISSMIPSHGIGTIVLTRPTDQKMRGYTSPCFVFRAETIFIPPTFRKTLSSGNADIYKCLGGFNHVRARREKLEVGRHRICPPRKISFRDSLLAGRAAVWVTIPD